MKTELYLKEEAKRFYENRYEMGYMDEWPKDKKQRVFEIISDLNLPERGVALDFGCGNGVFTDVMQQALPKWKIYGCDISKNAIENAKKRFPDCSFFVSDNKQSIDMKFDFLLSHHVLEHVFDIVLTMNEMNFLLKPISFVLHIFPCGNEGSFEYKVCKMRKDGINKKMENRFFFEDEGHIRRLTTEQTNELMYNYGFALEKAFYSNQYYGALQWISKYNKEFILNFTDKTKAVDKKNRRKLNNIRMKLLFFNWCQTFVKNNSQKSNFKLLGISFKKNVKAVFKIIILPFTKIIVQYINMKSKREWVKNKTQQNGSEMYLSYSRK